MKIDRPQIIALGRRSLISGAAATALMAAAGRQARAAGASAPPLTAPQVKAYARQPLARVLVGNTQFAVPDNILNDTTNNSLNSRKICFAPTLSDITDIVLAFPGFGLNNPEADLPQGYTVKASVEYPIGATPKQVFFSGATSAAIAVGRVLVKSDPLPITIPAGAKFAVKTYVTWTIGTFWLTIGSAATMVGEWTTRGAGVVDHTLDTTTLTTTSNIAGFGPVVYATLKNPIAVVGLIGDSIGTMTGDWVNPLIGYQSWGRALRGQIPFINLGKSGDSYTGYSGRAEGRNLVLRDGITHLIWEMGGNDLFGGVSNVTLQANLQAAIGPFLDRGVKCYAMTLTPRSTSTDNWITAVNQTVTNAGIETIRIAYNAWLRANWQSVGLSGYFDLAHAVDPNDTGKWGVDAAAINITPSMGLATLSGGTVASAANASYNSNSSAGTCVAGTAAVSCVVYNYPNTPGSGAVVNAVPDATNPWFSSYTVVTPGSGYTYAPMINPKGPWTADGLHPNARGCSEIIQKCGVVGGAFLAPETFVL